MSARNNSESSAGSSLDEDCQERGLRILGRLIAQRLMRQREGYDDNDDTSNHKKDDSQASGDPV
jgi:hypothetical protein